MLKAVCHLNGGPCKNMLRGLACNAQPQLNSKIVKKLLSQLNMMLMANQFKYKTSVFQ